MADATACAFPNHRAGTGYQYGCRCSRCREGWSDDVRRWRLRSAGLLVVLCPCGQPVAKGSSKFCSTSCRESSYSSYYERVEPTTGTCALPACHNLLISSFKRAAWCSDACKQIGKRLKSGRISSVHPHWLMSPVPLGPKIVECDVMSAPMLGPSLSDWPMFGPTSTPTARQCETCRRWFDGSGLTCSRLCSDQYHKIVKTNASCDIATGHCRRCSKPYARPASHDASGCCSPECTRRLRRSVERRARRARKRNQIHEPYTLREIAERDGWRCHLCGGKVPDRQYAARDRDATIDHLIPQSAGGDDIRLNVALAHNRCNWERKDQGAAQLRLTG